MLNNNGRGLIRAEVFRGMRRGPVIPRTEIDPYLHGARALVKFDARGPNDPTIVRMSQKREGENHPSQLDNFFCGTPIDGLFQLRELKPRCANQMPRGGVAIFDAPGLPSPIRAQFDSMAQISGVAVGQYQSSGALTLLSSSDTQILLKGAMFHALPLSVQVEDVYAVSSGNALIVRSRDTFEGPVLEYFYEEPGVFGVLSKLTPVKPAKDDPHGGSFELYLDTPDGRFMRFHDAKLRWAFQGHHAEIRAVRVPVHEYFAQKRIVWPE